MNPLPLGRGRARVVSACAANRLGSLFPRSEERPLTPTLSRAGGNVIAGDPARCIEIIHRWRELVGLTTISGTFHFAGMPQEMPLKNIRLFAERVMPAFERAGGPIGAS